MKMKTVCEQTGLTDRAVRYYIEEEILHPSFTENYLGRKTYDFSDEDVQMLKDIAVLRKFGFSVAQIKEMQTCPEKTYSIAEQLKEEKKEVIKNEQDLLVALEQLDAEQCYTLRELASVLSKPVTDKALPKEDTKWRLLKATCRVINIICNLFAVVPVLIVLLMIIASYAHFSYPTTDYKCLLYTVLFLLPNIVSVVLFFVKTNAIFKVVVRITLSAVCALCVTIAIMFSWGICYISETDNIYNYRNLDTDCQLNHDMIYQNLFPGSYRFDSYDNKITVPRTALYYYHHEYLLDPYDRGPCEIYTEFSTDMATIQEEKERIEQLFTSHKQTSDEFKLSTGTKGDYAYIMYHRGISPFTVTDTEDDKRSYIFAYYIFAYNEKAQTVRYLCGNTSYHYIPYCNTLDW